MDGIKNKLLLSGLHERHVGLTSALGDTFYEAASVCFDRHHNSPIDVEIVTNNAKNTCKLEFLKPNNRVLNAWANNIDTTESGAYGICLAAVESEEKLIAVKRAETLTGADWYIAPAGTVLDDLENCYRLEVSGVDAGSKTEIEYRLKQKVEQTKKGSSNLPAIASVVGFKEKIVLIRMVGKVE